jgi:hypothetical protein
VPRPADGTGHASARPFGALPAKYRPWHLPDGVNDVVAGMYLKLVADRSQHVDSGVEPNR